MRSKKLGLAAIAAAIVGTTVAWPALAHEAAVFHGSDYARVYNSHASIQACDGEGDGNGVKAHWRDSSGNITAGGWDTNGNDPGCATNPLPSSAVEFRICENNVGCSAWNPK